MKSQSVRLFAILFTVATLCSILLEVKGEGCMGKFKNAGDMKKHITTCKDKLGLKDEDISKNPTEDLPKNGYEDKCLFKCLMTEMKFVKDDGSVDFKAIEEDMKKNAPADKAEGLIAAIKTCSEVTAKDATISKDPCKAIAMTKVCYMKEDAKMC